MTRLTQLRTEGKTREGRVIGQDLTPSLSQIVGPGRVLTRPIHRIAYASDASFYRLIPQAVVQARTLEEVRALFAFARERRIPLVFRAAGTSLSGQAVTDGLLVDISRDWKRLEILDEGFRVRVEPGVIGGIVNQRLARYHRRLGPDPASIHACMIGGILANNSSGMCCGVAQNSYHTVEALRFVLPPGLVVDSGDPGVAALLEREAPSIARGLLDLRRRVLDSPALVERIRRKYRIKNTTGYSINAFVDFEEAVQILAHLMIGSEGTLGFIAEAVFRTVPDDPAKSTGLLFFHDVPAACAAIAPLRDSEAATLELMDREALRAVEAVPGVPDILRTLPPEAAALLVEYQAPDPAALRALDEGARRVFAALPLVGPPLFTDDPAEQAVLWRVRRGIIASVGARRESGTTVVIEDVAFPVGVLARAVADLQRLFAEHRYAGAVIFGHAKDGNLHFVLSQPFNDAPSVARYEAFMADLAELVVRRYDGSLKAEHGTGRNMAPFVEAEWGAEAYGIMREVKALLDPEGFLNPGVVVNDDPRAHVTHLKRLPRIEPEVDRCIECGWCEARCPSRALTLTPRQRIVVQREIARLRESREPRRLLRALEADYGYEVLDTCAADGMCATSCPVSIDTGQLVKRMRAERHGRLGRFLALQAAERLALVERLARGALGLGHALSSLTGPRTVAALSRAASGATRRALPVWVPEMPRPAPARLPRDGATAAAAVYFPSCLTRVFACEAGGGGSSLAQTVIEVARRAGVALRIPADAPGHCCGMPFSSKGYDEAHERVVRPMVDRLWEWSEEGRLPVFTDSSTCAFALRTCRGALDPERRARYDRIRILDGIDAAHDLLLPRLTARRRARRVVLHPVCSAVKLGLVPKLEAVVRAAAEEALVPVEAGCCGFAGDRGLFFPELTDSATAPEAKEVLTLAADGHYSSNRTCELALTCATGRTYRSFWQLLEWAT